MPFSVAVEAVPTVPSSFFVVSSMLVLVHTMIVATHALLPETSAPPKATLLHSTDCAGCASAPQSLARTGCIAGTAIVPATFSDPAGNATARGLQCQVC